MEPPYRTLDHRASQDTLISLLHLDPAPIESPTPTTTEFERGLRELDYDEDDKENMRSSSGTIRPGSTGTLGLSGSVSGPGAIYYLMRVQKFSSYAMGVFTSLHLANVSLIPAITRSVSGSETYLLMTRELYQTSLSEPFLVALPVLAHIGSGIALRWLRRSQNMRRYGASTPGMYALHRKRTSDTTGSNRSSVSLWPHLSYISISGYAFTIFYAAHAFMNRILPLQVEGDSSNIALAYVAHGFARHPIVANIAYVGLITIGCGHMIWGQAKWLGLAPATSSWTGRQSMTVDKKIKRQRRRKWFGVHGVALGVASLWAIGGLAVVARGGPADGWVGKLYDDMFTTVGL